MELSLFLAQLWGLSFVLIGLGMLLRPDMVQALARDFKVRSFEGYMAGMFALVVGLAMVLTHNVWDGTWHVVITLLGWLSFVKGLAFLFVPMVVERQAETMLKAKWLKAALVAMIVLGAYLAYVGFGF